MSEAQLKALLLPEILHLIFEHLAREAEGSSRERALTARAALARCARVNKLWSPLALRYLWRRAGYQGSEVLKVHNLLAKIHYRPGAACGFSDEKGCRQYYASFVKETAVFTYLREWEQEIETIEGVLREVTFMNLETLVVTAIPRTWKFYLPLLDCPRLRILVINLPGVLCGRSPSHGAYSNRLRANVYIDLVSDIVVCHSNEICVFYPFRIVIVEFFIPIIEHC